MIWEYLVICVVACNLETHLLKDVKWMNLECVYSANLILAFFQMQTGSCTHATEPIVDTVTKKDRDIDQDIVLLVGKSAVH